ncbi:hypothetical protein O9G_000414 [Rozella allomycis CSF55]|uniref:Uncharacterized protein n=1 Tax=Rozella allomycis (strain CSF55) TaxID=988480 RepID=A0A075AYN6_ROZAC|nr:hypothetical protein O9G_000414 [Rozella allomycis CSF55]|eukprot:EPZ33639.1 hypothetical protein O9G_000414 [Rozella allomycis CSF55]
MNARDRVKEWLTFELGYLKKPVDSNSNLICDGTVGSFCEEEDVEVFCKPPLDEMMNEAMRRVKSRQNVERIRRTMINYYKNGRRDEKYHEFLRKYGRVVERLIEREREKNQSVPVCRKEMRGDAEIDKLVERAEILKREIKKEKKRIELEEDREKMILLSLKKSEKRTSLIKEMVNDLRKNLNVELQRDRDLSHLPNLYKKCLKILSLDKHSRLSVEEFKEWISELKEFRLACPVEEIIPIVLDVLKMINENLEEFISNLNPIEQIEQAKLEYFKNFSEKETFWSLIKKFRKEHLDLFFEINKKKEEILEKDLKNKIDLKKEKIDLKNEFLKIENRLKMEIEKQIELKESKIELIEKINKNNKLIDEKQNQLKLTILETIQIEKLIHEIRFKIKNFVEKDLKDLKDEIQFKISSSRNSFLTEFESFSSCDFSINQKIKKLNNSLDLAFEDCPDLHLENISPESFIFNLFSDIISSNE